MDTENVEIIKAMVKTGLGIGIVPYQAIAREVRAEQFFCARIEGHQLVRETGWVYARANRVPRMIHELQTGVRRDQGPAAARAADRWNRNSQFAKFELSICESHDLKHRPSRLALDGDRSAVPLDDRFDDRQAEPAAVADAAVWLRAMRRAL